jgi:hypothetical protein
LANGAYRLAASRNPFFIDVSEKEERAFRLYTCDGNNELPTSQLAALSVSLEQRRRSTGRLQRKAASKKKEKKEGETDYSSELTLLHLAPVLPLLRVPLVVILPAPLRRGQATRPRFPVANTLENLLRLGIGERLVVRVKVELPGFPEPVSRGGSAVHEEGRRRKENAPLRSNLSDGTDEVASSEDKLRIQDELRIVVETSRRVQRDLLFVVNRFVAVLLALDRRMHEESAGQRLLNVLVVRLVLKGGRDGVAVVERRRRQWWGMGRLVGTRKRRKDGNGCDSILLSSVPPLGT